MFRGERAASSALPLARHIICRAVEVAVAVNSVLGGGEGGDGGGYNPCTR